MVDTVAGVNTTVPLEAVNIPELAQLPDTVIVFALASSVPCVMARFATPISPATVRILFKASIVRVLYALAGILLVSVNVKLPTEPEGSVSAPEPTLIVPELFNEAPVSVRLYAPAVRSKTEPVPASVNVPPVESAILPEAFRVEPLAIVRL